MFQQIYTTILEESELEDGLIIVKLESLRNTLPTDVLRKFRDFPYFGRELFCFPEIHVPEELVGTYAGQFANLYFSKGEPLSPRELVSDYNNFSKSVLHIALQNDVCVGGVWYEPQLKTREIPTHIIVDSKYRNNGIGSALEFIATQYVEKSAKYKKPKIILIQWPIHRTETDPQWFEELGYKITKAHGIYCARKTIVSD